MSSKSLYIICYDIQKDKSRNKIAELLSEYGKRVNYSVFECFVTPASLIKIQKALTSYCNIKTDFIKIYPICKDCFGKSQAIGNKEGIDQNHSIFI